MVHTDHVPALRPPSTRLRRKGDVAEAFGVADSEPLDARSAAQRHRGDGRRVRRCPFPQPGDDGTEPVDVSLLPRRGDIRELDAAEDSIEAHTGLDGSERSLT